MFLFVVVTFLFAYKTQAQAELQTTPNSSLAGRIKNIGKQFGKVVYYFFAQWGFFVLTLNVRTYTKAPPPSFISLRISLSATFSLQFFSSPTPFLRSELVVVVTNDLQAF